MADSATSKHSSRRERDPDRKSKKRRKHDDHGGKHKHRKKDISDHNIHIVDDDPDDGDMWVEKNIDMDGEKASV